jgi:hypothetical protein
MKSLSVTAGLGSENQTKCLNVAVSKGKIMEEKMKKFIPLFVLIGLTLVAVAIYKIVFHVGKPTRDLSGTPANFWWGLLQGLIVCLSFIASWFDNDVVFYQLNNNGSWHDRGYLIALSVFVGGIAKGVRTRVQPKNSRLRQCTSRPSPALANPL